MQIARIGNGLSEEYAAEMVGGKAANLARMAVLGLPVPPAFVLADQPLRRDRGGQSRRGARSCRWAE